MERRKPPKGNKQTFQVLLDPNRAKLLDDIAKNNNKKPAALLREAAYEFIQSQSPTQDYEEALLKDEELWAKAVLTRVQTCTSNRKIRESRFSS